MKWKESDFKNGIKTIKSVLIYGPDAGQVDELCDKAIDILQIDKDNLFTLDASDFNEKQDMVFAEGCSPSMFGGQKMIVISNAGDSHAKQVSELISHPGLCATVIICAGELRAGGGLRTMFETADNFAALPCYTDDARTLAGVIRDTLFSGGTINQITPDAMDYMTAHLGGDRAITRGFLAKIALYVGDKNIVELDDVEKCLPDTSASDIDDYLYSLTAGYVSQTMTALDRLMYDNVEPNMLIRMLDTHFKKLLTAVVDGQIPRLFWKVADKFNRAVKIWSESDIDAVLTRLNELEMQLRTRGMPGDILLRDFSLKLALKATKMATRRRK